MNSGDSTTTKSFRLLVNLSDKKNLKRSYKYVASSNISMYYTQKNIENFKKRNPFELSTPTWKEKFECGGSYSIADI